MTGRICKNMSDKELTLSTQTNICKSDIYESEESQIETSASSKDSLEKSVKILNKIGGFLKSDDFVYGEEYFNDTKNVRKKWLVNDCTVPSGSGSYNVDRTFVDHEATYQTKNRKRKRLDVPNESEKSTYIAKDQEYYAPRKRLPDSALGFEHNLKVVDNAYPNSKKCKAVPSKNLKHGTKPFKNRKRRIKQKLKPLCEDQCEHNPKFIHKIPSLDNSNSESNSIDMSENSNIDAIQKKLCDADSDSDEDLELKLKMKLLPYYKRNYFKAKAEYLKNLYDVSENSSFIGKLKGYEQSPHKQCRNAFMQVYGPNQTLYNNVIPKSESLKEFKIKLKKKFKKKQLNRELMLEKQLLNKKLSSAEESSLDSDDTDDTEITNNNSSGMFLPERLNSSKDDKELMEKSKTNLKTYKRIFRKSDSSDENDSLDDEDIKAISDALQYLDFIKTEPSAGQGQAIHCSAISKKESEEKAKKLDSDPSPAVQPEKYISHTPNTTANCPPVKANESQAIQRDKYLELHNFYMTFWGNSHLTIEDLCCVENKLVKQIFGETVGTSELNIPMDCGLDSESYCNRSQLDKSLRKSSTLTVDTAGNRFNRKREHSDATEYKNVPNKKRKLPKDPLNNVRLNGKQQHRPQEEGRNRKRRQSNEPDLTFCGAAKKLKLSHEDNLSDPTTTIQNIKQRQPRKQLSPPDKINELQSKSGLPQKKRRERKRQHQLTDTEFCSCRLPVAKEMKLSNDDKITPAEYAKKKQRRVQAYSSDKDIQKKGRKNDRFQKHAEVEKAKRKRRLTNESDIPECSRAKRFKNSVNDDDFASSIYQTYDTMKSSKGAIKKTEEFYYFNEDILNSELPLSNEFDFCDCDSDSDSESLPPEEVLLYEEEISTEVDKQHQYSEHHASKNKRGRPPKPSSVPRHRKPCNKAAQKYKSSQPQKNKKVSVKKKNTFDDLKHCLSNSLNAYSITSFKQRLVSNFNRELTGKLRPDKNEEKKKQQNRNANPPTKRRDPGILRRRYAD